jgi:hypothetical protein
VREVATIKILIQGEEGSVLNSPSISPQEADEQLDLIEAALGKPEALKLPWIRVLGEDVRAAWKVER